MARHVKGTKWTEEQVDALRAGLRDFLLKTDTPYINTFLARDDVFISPDRFCHLANDWPELRETADICKAKCTGDLIKGALTRKYDNAFAIFMLKNVAGWRDEKYIDDKKVTPTINIVNYGTTNTSASSAECRVPESNALLASRGLKGV